MIHDLQEWLRPAIGRIMRLPKTTEAAMRRISMAACLLGPMTPLEAHPISLSTAVADIRTNQVLVEMRILVEDLVLFQSLKPDDNQVVPADSLKQAAEVHHQFLLDYFHIRDFDGKRLQGKVNSTDVEEIPPAGVRMDELMSFSVYYILEFALSEPPSFLTFSQNFGGDEVALPAVMDLIPLQNGARLDFPKQIGPMTPWSMPLDWENPATNDRKSWRERRALMKQRKEELLGITDYGSTYSYIYITANEVRHEILVPLLTLENWLPLDRANPDFLEVEEQEKAKIPIQDFFKTHAPVFIDGTKTAPVLSRLDFYSLDIRDFAQRSPQRDVSVYNARAGIILTYAVKSAPRTVEITWDIFDKYTPLLNSLVYVFRENASRHFFVPSEPTFHWKNPNPSAAESHVLHPVPKPPAHQKFNLFGVRKPPQLTETQATAVFEPLLNNVYASFEFGDEVAVYDALARNVSGDLLQELYLMIRKALEMQEQGGAVSRVEEVELVNGRISSSEPSGRQNTPAFAYEGTWNVTGSVEHWGHIHRRQNQYYALFEIAVVDQAWKFTAMDVLDEKRLNFETGLREMGAR